MFPTKEGHRAFAGYPEPCARSGQREPRDAVPGKLSHIRGNVGQLARHGVPAVIAYYI